MNFLWNELFVKWTFCEMNFCEMNFCEMILFVKWLVLWNDTFVKWTFMKRYICEMNFCEMMHPRSEVGGGGVGVQRNYILLLES